MDRSTRALRPNETEVIVAEQKTWYLVSYDIRDDKRLRRVAKHLEGFGARIQYSVFRCRLTQRQIERLKWELTEIMDKDDNLLVIGICWKCAQRIRRRSSDEAWAEDIKTYEVV